jgi:WD40 repeat protein
LQPSLSADEVVQVIPIVAPQRTDTIDFAADLLPMLRKNCIACHHGPEAESGVELDSAAAIRRGADGKILVVPGKGNESLLLRVAARQRKPVMPPPDNKVGAAALTGEQLGLLRLWIDQGAKGESNAAMPAPPRRPLPASLQPMLAMALSPDDEMLACSRGQRLQVYDLRGPRLAAELADPQFPTADGHGSADVDLIRSLAFDKSGTILASGGYRTVRLWQRPHAALVSRTNASGKMIRSMAVSPDGKVLAIGSETGNIELRPLAGDGKTLALTGHSGPVTALVFTSSGLLSASLDKTIRRWNLADGAAAGKWSRPTEVRALAVVGSGDQVASGEADAVIRIWPVAALADPAAQEMLPAPQLELKGHAQAVTSLAAVPALKDRLLSGSEDGRLRLWDTTTGMAIRDMGQETPVTAVALRPDGRRAASIGPKSARLWNVEDGGLIAEIKGDYRRARDVARADGALFYAKACVEYRKQDFREAEETLKREIGVAEGAVKAREMAEKTAA